MYEDELIPLFEECGTIWDLRLMMDPMTGTNRGYAFITFATRDAASNAVQEVSHFFLLNLNFQICSFFCAVTKIDLWAFTFPDILFQWYHVVQMTNILKTQSRWMDYSFTLYLSSQNSAFSPRVLCSNFLKISRNFRSRHLINTESIKGANKKEMSDTLYITQKLRWLDWWWLDSQS